MAPGSRHQLHGGTRSIALTAASRARYRAGFQHYRARWAYNVILPRAQEVLGVERKVHTAEHLASAMFYLGAPPREIPRATLYAEPWPTAPALRGDPPVRIGAGKDLARRPLHRGRPRALRDSLDPVILCGPDDDPSAFAGFETRPQRAARAK